MLESVGVIVAARLGLASTVRSDVPETGAEVWPLQPPEPAVAVAVTTMSGMVVVISESGISHGTELGELSAPTVSVFVPQGVAPILATTVTVVAEPPGVKVNGTVTVAPVPAHSELATLLTVRATMGRVSTVTLVVPLPLNV